MNKRFLFALTALLLSSCVGPLVLHETARTVGSGHNEFLGGFGRAGIALKWNYGITDRLDFGLQFESLSTGLRLKYAWYDNQEQGWSFASAVGLGTSIGGKNYYLDTIVSHLHKRWEPYGAFRFVHVNIDSIEARNRDTGDVSFTTPNFDFDYGQFMVGTRYWMTPTWLLSLEISDLVAFSSGI